MALTELIIKSFLSLPPLQSLLQPLYIFQICCKWGIQATAIFWTAQPCFTPYLSILSWVLNEVWFLKEKHFCNCCYAIFFSVFVVCVHRDCSHHFYSSITKFGVITQYVLIVAGFSYYSSKTLFAGLTVFQSLGFSFSLSYKLQSLFLKFLWHIPQYKSHLSPFSILYSHSLPLSDPFDTLSHCSHSLRLCPLPLTAESVVRATGLNRLYLLSLLLVLKYHRDAYTRKMLCSCK